MCDVCKRRIILAEENIRDKMHPDKYAINADNVYYLIYKRSEAVLNAYDCEERLKRMNELKLELHRLSNDVNKIELYYFMFEGDNAKYADEKRQELKRVKEEYEQLLELHEAHLK